MTALALRLLGPPCASREGRVLAFRSRKQLALLAYLAVEQRHSHSRDTLLGLLWPEAAEEAARNNLRVALADLRRLLGVTAIPFLRAGRQSVQFDPDSDHSLDVASFRALLAAYRTHAHDALERCDACLARLSEAVALYGGEFLAGFSLPDSAAFEEWAIVVREQLAQQALDALDTLATAHERLGDYPAQCRYARRQLELEPWREEAHRQLMRALAASGDRAAALAAYERCQKTLHNDLGIEPDAATTALYAAIKDGSWQPEGRSALAAHRTTIGSLPAKPPPELPMPLSPMLGRDRELARIVELLTSDGERMVTLVGAGGVGKTRLALAASHALHQKQPGVYWTALAGVGGHDAPGSRSADEVATQLATAIAEALALALTGDQAVTAQVRAALRTRAVLLVLDNLEHLLAATPWLLEVLQQAPQVQLLITSRERLNVGAEVVLPLDGLPLPPTDDDPAAASYSGVQLFLQRAARSAPALSASADELAGVVRVCRLLDGVPLGIELAAHWVAHYSLSEIADALVKNIGFLTPTQRDYPQRQRSLRAVFAYSWELLPPAEQQALARLSVFRGSFSREAAEFVAQTSVSVLAALLDKSLLRQAGVGRYALHELLRQFAAEHLHEQDATVATRARHARYYLAFVATTLAGSAQSAELAALEREHDNLRAALGWARESGEIELGLRLGGVLWPFWQRRCHLIEGRRWLEDFLAAPGAQAVAPEVRATALIGAGWLAHDQDDFVRADALFEEGLSLERALGHTGRVAAVLAHRGIMARGLGQYAQATALIEESLALSRAAQDQDGVAYALFRLGLVTRERGDFARATTIYQECLAAYQALGDRNRAVFALLGLGDIARDQGDAAQLEAYCLESLAICRELGQHVGVGYSLNNLALAAAMQGDLLRAEALAEEALNLFRTHGIRGGVVELLITHGQIACSQGDYEGARAALAEGVTQGWPAGPHDLVATGLEELARVAIAAGDAAHAARLCAAAAAWRAAMDAPLQPYRRAAYEATLAAARRALGADPFATVWAEGAAWRPSQAVAAALAAPRAEPETAFQSVGGWPEGQGMTLEASLNPPTPTHNLPAMLTPFVGREAELSQLAAWLTHPGSRLITLVGPGGIGKTRLALELALRHVAHFADGVFLVRLASIHQPEVVASVIAQTLGFKESGGHSPAELLTIWLRDKRLVLILDNCEHLLVAAPLVTELLAAAPGLSVLATSREPLHVSGEHLFQVPALALPPTTDDQRPAADEPWDGLSVVKRYAAVALFVQRVQAVRPDFTLTAENASTIVEICARVDGLPLALELAAARSQRLSPHRMLEYLKTRPGGLQILVGGGRDLPARQQTMRATIAWSYDLLNPVEQVLFHRLAVFVGGWTAEAAEAVCELRIGCPLGDEKLRKVSPESAILNSQFSILNSLDSLVDKSLIIQTEEHDGAPRFTMLETIREYALERLEESGEAEAVCRRHSAFFLALAEEAEPQQVVVQHELIWLARLAAEQDNLRAALRWALDHRDTEVGLRLAGALWLFWDLRSSYSEGRGWLTALLEIDSEDGANPTRRMARAKALNAAAMLAYRQSDYQRAAEHAEESLALYRDLRDERGIARALLTLGNVLGLGLGQFQQAAELYEEALALQRNLNNRPGMSIALFNLGLMNMARGDYTRAQVWFEDAERLYDELQSARWVIRVQPYLAAAVLFLGDRERAADLINRALTWRERVGDKDMTFTIQSLLKEMPFAMQSLLVAAGIAEAQGQAARAAQLLGAMDALDDRIGAPVSRRGAKRLVYERISTAVRDRLDAAAFASAWAAGRAMTLEQAVAAALAATAVPGTASQSVGE